MNSSTFVETAIRIAKDYKSLYVMGCFGAPMNEKNKARYTKNYSYNKQAARTAMIQAASADTFGFFSFFRANKNQKIQYYHYVKNLQLSLICHFHYIFLP